MLEITAPFQTMQGIQELSTPALFVNHVDSAHRNISHENFGKSATVTAWQSIIKSHSRPEPTELQGILATCHDRFMQCQIYAAL